MNHEQANVFWGGLAAESECYGGEHTEAPYNEDVRAEAWRPIFSVRRDKLTAILSRHHELAAASRQGRKSATTIQMKISDDCFHSRLSMIFIHGKRVVGN